MSLSRADDFVGETDDLVGAFGIERGGVLVQQQQFGLEPGGHQQRQGLPLSAGKAADRVVDAIFQSHVQRADAVAQFVACSFRCNAQPSPRGWPRRAAMARFSAMVMFGAVPLKGFWKTRPMSRARLCSGQRVMSRPASVMRAGVHEKRAGDGVEQSGFSRAVGADDDEKRSRFQRRARRPRSARTSLGVPGLKSW